MKAMVMPALSVSTSSELPNVCIEVANGSLSVLITTNIRLQRMSPMLASRSQLSRRSCCVVRSANRPAIINGANAR